MWYILLCKTIVTAIAENKHIKYQPDKYRHIFDNYDAGDALNGVAKIDENMIKYDDEETKTSDIPQQSENTEIVQNNDLKDDEENENTAVNEAQFLGLHGVKNWNDFFQGYQGGAVDPEPVLYYGNDHPEVNDTTDRSETIQGYMKLMGEEGGDQPQDLDEYLQYVRDQALAASIRGNNLVQEEVYTPENHGQLLHEFYDELFEKYPEKTLVDFQATILNTLPSDPQTNDPLTQESRDKMLGTVQDEDDAKLSDSKPELSDLSRNSWDYWRRYFHAQDKINEEDEFAIDLAADGIEIEENDVNEDDVENLRWKNVFVSRLDRHIGNFENKRQQT